MDVIDDKQDGLLTSQPVEQSKDRFEQAGSLHARITEWGRGRRRGRRRAGRGQAGPRRALVRAAPASTVRTTGRSASTTTP